MANAIGMRCYSEDEFCERSKDTGGEQSKGNEERRRRAPIYRRIGCLQLRQLLYKVATETKMCHRARKR